MTSPKKFAVVSLRLPVAIAQAVNANPIEAALFLQKEIEAMQANIAQPYTEQLPLLHRAENLIKGERQKDYGDKLQNFSQIAMLWTGQLACKLQPGQAITPEDVATCMIHVKLARLAKSPTHADSILDVAGYIGCYDKLQLERGGPSVSLFGATVDAGALESQD